MVKKKYPVEETKCVDYCICPYCGHKFNGKLAINGNLDERIIECPICEKEMEVFPSVKYTCTAIPDID